MLLLIDVDGRHESTENIDVADAIRRSFVFFLRTPAKRVSPKIGHREMERCSLIDEMSLRRS